MRCGDSTRVCVPESLASAVKGAEALEAPTFGFNTDIVVDLSSA